MAYLIAARLHHCVLRYALPAILLTLVALPAAAKDCVPDSGGGCERDGLTCSPSDDPPNNGKCLTVKGRVLGCICHYTKPAGREPEPRPLPYAPGTPPEEPRPR
jgi:hypothetical protein